MGALTPFSTASHLHGLRHRTYFVRCNPQALDEVGMGARTMLTVSGAVERLQMMFAAQNSFFTRCQLCLSTFRWRRT